MKRRHIYRSIISVCAGTMLLITSGICAQNRTPIAVEELKSEMLIKTTDLVSVSCDFEQNKHLEYLDAVVSSTGKLVFDKNNRLRWEYKEPFEYLIVINNGKFSIKTDGRINEYDIESNQLFSQISELIISSVNGTIFTDPAFGVSAFKNGSEYIVFMEPTVEEMKEVLRKIEMHINVADFSVNKVIMFEQEDNFTEIKFINKVFNAALPGNTFSCD
ncbi:outer membrane lipoprotein carrier protein LolA [Carboxylicivirga sp. RSCT41]|uniref:outer membrane lipoprotein carrier protein LolA n=1 Tax=Carboxylicivirga agarovorans TaxID=3417570 RepID=UPI003D3397D9